MKFLIFLIIIFSFNSFSNQNNEFSLDITFLSDAGNVDVMNFGDKLTYRNTKATGSWKDSIGDYGIIKSRGFKFDKIEEKPIITTYVNAGIYIVSRKVLKSIKTGMNLKPYRTNSIDKIFSCTVSHAKLWLKCVKLEEEIMILEHDAIFTRKFEPFEWEGGVIGLNDPRGATHSSLVYHTLMSYRKGVSSAPWVGSETSMPQGLAGNSAYIIKPYFAEKLLNKLKEKGAWPNDALMCKQFFPNELKVIYPYYTAIQRIRSTTTL